MMTLFFYCFPIADMKIFGLCNAIQQINETAIWPHVYRMGPPVRWGGSFRGGVHHVGVGWVMQGWAVVDHAGVGCIM